jgi:hypothetical protein
MTTALDPAASPQCVFGADGRLRCAAEDGPYGMWGPRSTGAPAKRIVDAEKMQAARQRQWLWEQQRAVASDQQHQNR